MRRRNDCERETYDALSDHLDGMAVEWDKIIIEYIEPVSSVRVY